MGLTYTNPIVLLNYIEKRDQFEVCYKAPSEYLTTYIVERKNIYSTILMLFPKSRKRYINEKTRKEWEKIQEQWREKNDLLWKR